MIEYLCVFLPVFFRFPYQITRYLPRKTENNLKETNQPK